MKARFFLPSCLFLTALGAAAFPQEESFADRFRKAMKAGDDAKLAALVEAESTAAAEAIVELCERISEGSSEKMEREIDAYRKAWKATIGTHFVDAQYEFFSLMRPDFRQARQELKNQYQNELTRFDEAVAAERFEGLPGLGPSFEAYGDGFLEVGDTYYGAQAWLQAAWCYDEKYLEDDARLEPAYDAYKKTLQLRDELGLKDQRTAEVKERFGVLEAAGVGTGVEIVGGLANKAVEAGAAIRLEPTFELVTDFEGIDRPIYSSDENYQVWTEIYLGKNGATAKFGSMAERSPTLIRDGASAVSIDVSGDGTGDVQVPITGNIMPIELTLGTGDDARPWGFLATVGQTQDRFQGFDYNLGPDSDQLRLYVAPAASLVALAGETRIQVFDDNMDGFYGSGPMYWPFLGLLPESLQVDLDSVLIGKSRVAVPWSEYQLVEGQWYRFDRNETGMDISMTPVEVPTGTLELDFKGLTPDYVVVKGSGKYKDCYFDLAVNGKKGTAVPVGKYSLVSGQVSKGKRRQITKALLLPGEGKSSWDVAEGQKVAIQMGAPFGFQFEITQTDDSVTVLGSSIAVTGAGGESYQRFWNCVPTPEVSMRKAGTKKGSKGEEMRAPASQDDVVQAGLAAAWHAYDLALEKKKAGEEVEVQLVEKKNALFGKIESEWRK